MKGLKRAACLLLLGVILICLTACKQETAAASPQTVYEIPAMKTAEFHKEKARDEDGVLFDDSALSDGYVAVSAVSETRLKFQVRCGDTTYTYDLPKDGTPQVFPLNLGDGTYTFRLMENLSEQKYRERWSTTEQVTLNDEFEPFLRPSQMVSYDADSACAAEAKNLASGCEDDTAVVSAVYAYLVDTISYDGEKAKTVQSGYLPNPDETLSTKKGICFDYAALAAAMFRSVGIPCKLITGYVGGEELYHAWNTIYLKDQGWITVEIKANADSWKRVDITFAASGVSADQTDDDTRYTTRYVY